VRASVALAALVLLFDRWLHVGVMSVGFTFLLVVLLTAATARFWAAAAASLAAMLALNFFFLPPVRSLYLSDPQNWVALFVFLAVSLVGSNLSTTARKRAEEAIERQRESLEQRRTAELARQGEELKSALLASLGHDLRTPLTAIRVAASNLRASWLQDGDRREQSDLILQEVDRLQRLFQNILEMARIDAGTVSADRRWVHPSEIVEAARDLVELALRHHSIDLRIESDDAVRLDPRLTAAALAHVLENAAQYSPAESPIVVNAASSSQGLSITVRDGGAGIAPQDLPHVFDRFYRGAESKRRVAGTGMGLSIARGLLAVEQGRIRAENPAQGGAQFTITVPAEWRPPDTFEQSA
jgi:two-component system sensor histidine kinase KdpD